MDNEVSTSKIIIKTIAVFLIFALFVASVFMVFFPKTIANVTKDLGMKSISLKFENASYQKTGDINSLNTLLSNAIYNENDEGIVEYGMQMLNHKDYRDYNDFMNQNSIVGSYFNVYCETYTIESLYNLNMKDEALAVLSNSVTTGYDTNGVGLVLCKAVVSNSDNEFAGKILNIYEENFKGASDLKAYNIAIEATILTKNCLESENDVWQERLTVLNEKYA